MRRHRSASAPRDNSDALPYDEPRDDMTHLVPSEARRVLDVGCSTGRFGESLKQRGHEVVWGIDPTPPPADRPVPYDRRIVGSFPDALPDTEVFDCIVFNDVLEHLVDPWHALRTTRSLLHPAGTVVASLPNVAHLSVIASLALRQRWQYRDWGILDRTHLRFFTKSTMVELFETCGYSVTAIEPHWVSGDRFGARPLIRRLHLEQFAAHQFALIATPNEHAPRTDQVPS